METRLQYPPIKCSTCLWARYICPVHLLLLNLFLNQFSSQTGKRAISSERHKRNQLADRFFSETPIPLWCQPISWGISIPSNETFQNKVLNPTNKTDNWGSSNIFVKNALFGSVWLVIVMGEKNVLFRFYGFQCFPKSEVQNFVVCCVFLCQGHFFFFTNYSIFINYKL